MSSFKNMCYVTHLTIFNFSSDKNLHSRRSELGSWDGRMPHNTFDIL